MPAFEAASAGGFFRKLADDLGAGVPDPDRDCAENERKRHANGSLANSAHVGSQMRGR
jgi:hypothetical protein